MSQPFARMITHAQRGKILATYRDMGMDRDERLADISAVIYRPVTSANDLSQDEASMLIDMLSRREDPTRRAS